jgi:hypothetical protein
VTKATIPNQTATPRANAEYVRQSRIESNTKNMPAFFPKTLYKARARIEQAVGKLKRRLANPATKMPTENLPPFGGN